MNIGKSFEWVTIPPHNSETRVSHLFRLTDVQDDIVWAKGVGKEKVKELLLSRYPFPVSEASLLARQLSEEVTQRLNGNGTGEIHIGNKSTEQRLVYYFIDGSSTHLRKVIKPCAIRIGREQKQLALPRVIRILLVNVKSSGYPLITAPLALTTLGGYLRNTFSDSVIIDYLDLQLESGLTSVETYLEENQPDIIGLSVKVGGAEEMFDLLEMLAKVECTSKPMVVLGNVVPTYASDGIHHRFPWVVCSIGRGELTLQSLVEHTALGLEAKDLIHVPGCSYVMGNEIHEIEGLAFDLQDLGIPDWSSLFNRYPPNSYQEIWIEASRGCPQKRGGVGCSFCAIMPTAGSRDWRSRTGKDVLTEIKNLSTLGVKHLRFADEEFMAGQTTASLELAQQLFRFRQDLEAEQIEPPTFDFAIRVDDVIKRGVRDNKQVERNIDGKTVFISNNEVRKLALQTFKSAGLTQVYLGIESGSFNQLKRMYKAVLPKDNEAAIEVLRELGLQVAGGWIMIDPLMEGLNDLNENIEFIERNHLIPKAPEDDFITNPISRMRVLEGSPLVDQLREQGLLGHKKQNLIEYDFIYKDRKIALIATLLERWEEGIAPFVYALKNIVALGALEKNSDEEIARLSESLFKLKALNFSLVKALVIESVHSEVGPTLIKKLDQLSENFRDQRKSILLPLINDLKIGLLNDGAGMLHAGIRSSAELRYLLD